MQSTRQIIEDIGGTNAAIGKLQSRKAECIEHSTFGTESETRALRHWILRCRGGLILQKQLWPAYCEAVSYTVAELHRFRSKL